MNHNYRIDFENIILRPLIMDDIEKLRIWRNDQKNSQFLRKIPFITKEMQSAWFEKYTLDNDEICFAIVEKRELNRLVGSLSLYEFSNNSCFLGKILIGDAEAQGRKVGTNASIAATMIAFEQLDIKVINLFVYADNYAAVKVYKNAGFTIVGEHGTESGKKEYLMIKQRV